MKTMNMKSNEKIPESLPKSWKSHEILLIRKSGNSVNVLPQI